VSLGLVEIFLHDGEPVPLLSVLVLQFLHEQVVLQELGFHIGVGVPEIRVILGQRIAVVEQLPGGETYRNVGQVINIDAGRQRAKLLVRCPINHKCLKGSNHRSDVHPGSYLAMSNPCTFPWFFFASLSRSRYFRAFSFNFWRSRNHACRNDSMNWHMRATRGRTLLPFFKFLSLYNVHPHFAVSSSVIVSENSIYQSLIKSV